MTASHSSSLMFTSIRSRRMPALFTSTCRSPNVSTAALTSRSAPSQSVTSSWLAMAAPPASTISSTTSPRESASTPVAVEADPPRSLTTTIAPSDGEQERVLAADATPRSRDDGDPALQCVHVVVLLSLASLDDFAVVFLRTSR